MERFQECKDNDRRLEVGPEEDNHQDEEEDQDKHKDEDDWRFDKRIMISCLGSILSWPATQKNSEVNCSDDNLMGETKLLIISTKLVVKE